jgi:hypothetical protein
MQMMPYAVSARRDVTTGLNIPAEHIAIGPAEGRPESQAHWIRAKCASCTALAVDQDRRKGELGRGVDYLAIWASLLRPHWGAQEG